MSSSRRPVLALACLLAAASVASAAFTVETFAQANYGGVPYVRQDNASSYASAQQGTHSNAWSSVVDGRLKAYSSADMDANGVMASSSAWVRLQDVLTVGGTNGDAVQFRITYSVHGSLFCDRPTLNQDDAWGAATINAQIISRGQFENGTKYFYKDFDFRLNSPANNPNSVSTIVSTFEGQTISINLFLNSQVFSGVSDNFDKPAVSAMSDFGNTSVFSIEPLTPGASYVSASGFSYPVPEPSVAGVLVVTLGLLSRRRH